MTAPSAGCSRRRSRAAGWRCPSARPAHHDFRPVGTRAQGSCRPAFTRQAFVGRQNHCNFARPSWSPASTPSRTGCRAAVGARSPVLTSCRPGPPDWGSEPRRSSRSGRSDSRATTGRSIRSPRGPARAPEPRAVLPRWGPDPIVALRSGREGSHRLTPQGPGALEGGRGAAAPAPRSRRSRCRSPSGRATGQPLVSQPRRAISVPPEDGEERLVDLDLAGAGGSGSRSCGCAPGSSGCRWRSDG